MRCSLLILSVSCCALLACRHAPLVRAHIVVDSDCALTDSAVKPRLPGFTLHIESDTSLWSQTGASAAGVNFTVDGGPWRPGGSGDVNAKEVLLNQQRQGVGTIANLDFATVAPGQTFTGRATTTLNDFSCTVR